MKKAGSGKQLKRFFAFYMKTFLNREQKNNQAQVEEGEAVS